MKTLIAVGGGLIGILLGVVGVVTSLNPPKSPKIKLCVVAAFAALSLVAMITTVVDRRWSEKSEQESKAKLENLNTLAAQLTEQNKQLIATSSQLSEQNQQLLLSNAIPREKVAEAANAPHQVAMGRTLKNDIQRHLSKVQGFLANKSMQFQKRSIPLSKEEYQKEYSIFRGQLAAQVYIRLLYRSQQIVDAGGIIMNYTRFGFPD